MKTSPDGEGFVSYTVQPKASAATGAIVNAQGTVVFDQNAPINTQQISNTVDATIPTSSVTALPAMTTSADFTVSWSGSDDAGSGIAGYDVYVSDDGSPFTPFETDTTATSATFDGQFGHTYSFYSVATSNVGYIQFIPTAAQATTRLVSVPTSSVTALPATTGAPTFNLSWSGSPGQGPASPPTPFSLRPMADRSHRC